MNTPQMSQEDINKFFGIMADEAEGIEGIAKSEVQPTPKREYKKRGRKKVPLYRRRLHVALYFKREQIERLREAYATTREMSIALLASAEQKLKAKEEKEVKNE